jgi:class 3 adenylate cyclase
VNDSPPNNTLQQWSCAGVRALLLALVFTDIVGSTRKCDQLGDEVWTEILISHFRRARKVVKQFSGFEIKIIGDAFMVAFRSVREAICFAMELQRKTGHAAVSIRAGVHVGPVRVIDNDIYGSMVNYTSRVIHALEGEAVAISEDAMHYLANDIGKKESEALAKSTSVRFKGWDQDQTISILRPEAWWKHAECHPLPDIDVCLVPGTDESRFPVVQAELADIAWIAQLEASAYTSEDAVPEGILLSWFRRNPHGFSVIENSRGERIGHIDILPLRTDVAQPFLKGRIVEKEIPADWIFPPSAKERIRDLYVESIIIKKTAGLFASPALFCVLQNFNSLIERICCAEQVSNVYAIEATASGKKLITRIGFEGCGEASARTDDHELFKISVTALRANVEKLVNRQ